MLLRIISFITIVFLMTASVAFASDWVDDEDLNGFYKHEVKKGTGEPEPGYSEPVTRPPTYRTLGGSSTQSPMVTEPGGSSYGGSMADFASPVTVPPMSTTGINPPASSQPAKKKGFFGKLGSTVKSIAGIPADAVEGTGALLSSPLFWQSAGAIAGAGANAYMTHQYYKNNPGVYNPYYGGLGYGGLGYGGMGYGGLGYGGMGYGGLGGWSNPYYGFNGLGYGGMGGYGGSYYSPGIGNYYNPGLGYGFGGLGGLGYNGLGYNRFGQGNLSGLYQNPYLGTGKAVDPGSGWLYNITTPNLNNPASIPRNSVFGGYNPY